MDSKLYQTYHRRFHFWKTVSEKATNRLTVAKASYNFSDMFHLLAVQNYCTIRMMLAEQHMEQALIVNKAIEEYYER